MEQAKVGDRDRIVQVSGFGVEYNSRAQSDIMVVGLTQDGRVVITNGDGIWCDISPKEG